MKHNVGRQVSADSGSDVPFGASCRAWNSAFQQAPGGCAVPWSGGESAEVRPPRPSWAASASPLRSTSGRRGAFMPVLRFAAGIGLDCAERALRPRTPDAFLRCGRTWRAVNSKVTTMIMMRRRRRRRRRRSAHRRTGTGLGRRLRLLATQKLGQQVQAGLGRSAIGRARNLAF